MIRSAIALALVVLVLFLQSSVSHATASPYFAPCGPASAGSSSPGAPSDVTTIFGIGLNPLTCGPFSSALSSPRQYDWQKLIYFTPPRWTVAKDADIQDGTQVGTFKSKITLGLLNNPCNTILLTNYTLFEGTINESNPLAALPQGSRDRLSPMAADANANGAPDAADRWPSYLNAVAGRLGMDLSGLVARYVGVDNRDVPGTTMVANFLVFKPGATVSSNFAVDPRLGYATVLVLQDPTSAGSNQDPVSSNCAPLWTQLTLNGTAAGRTFRGNPGDGTYNFVTWAMPQPDADGDGIENRLDPCPLTPNPGWNPSVANFPVPAGDSDNDGIPNECDPYPNVPSTHNAADGIANADEDGDGWQNRGDNCPLVANLDQLDTDGDDIGDACDPNPISVDGANPPACVVTPVTIGNGGPQPVPPEAMTPCNLNASLGPLPIGGVADIVTSGPQSGTSVSGWVLLCSLLALVGLASSGGLWTARWRSRR